MSMFLGVSPSNYFYRAWFLACFVCYIVGVGFDCIDSHAGLSGIVLTRYAFSPTHSGSLHRTIFESNSP